MDCRREIALRAHIRERLLDYALTHLTEDYVAFTENAVVELLSERLVKIPTTDPNSLTLPSDPFETLSRSYGLEHLEPYDQRWTTDADSVKYIKRMIVGSGETMVMTDKCWLQDAQFDANYVLLRPMSPMLTISSRRLTPKLGSNIFLESFPTSLSDTAKSKLIETVEEQVVEEVPVLKIDDALDLETVLDVETHKAMVSLLKSIPLHVDPAYKNTHVEAFLRDCPPPLSTREPLFVPIFSRHHVLGYVGPSNNHPPLMGLELANLSSLVPKVEIEDEDVDRYKENMVVVDGWQTYASSSPSDPATPTSSQSDHEDQIDEFFMHSSPNTDPAPIQILMKTMMDEVEIPRVNKFGNAAENVERIGEGKSLASFILPFIPTHRPISNNTLSSLPPLSIVGQASSAIVPTEDNMDIDIGFEKDDLDATISRIYEHFGDQVPEEMILLEKLDEKGGLLMEVLSLPSPNVHPQTEMFLPADLRMLVVSSGCKREIVKNGNLLDGEQGILRRAKGNHSLAMELSWIPFKSSLKAVTNEHVANVADFVGGRTCEYDVDEDKVARLLEQAVGINLGMDQQCDRCLSTGLWLDIGDGNDYAETKAFTYGEDGSEMALTREERKRFYGIIDVEPQNSSDRPMCAELEDRPEYDIAKEMDTAFHEYHHSDTNNHPGQTEPHLDWDGQPGVNDSGISFPPTYELLSQSIDRYIAGADSPSRNGSPDADKENMPLISGVDSTTAYLSEWLQFAYEEELLIGYVPLETGEPTFRVSANTVDRGVESPILSSLSSDSRRDILVVSPQLHRLASEPEIGRLSTLVPASMHYSEPTPDLAGRSKVDEYAETASSPCPPLRTPPIRSDVDTSRPVFPGRSSAVVEFAKLRSKHVSESETIASSTTEAIASSVPDPAPAPLQVPKELLDSNTISIPSTWPLPASLHRYLASMDVIQKQCLVRSFRTAQCSVDLVERDTLGGVDIIIDPHTAVFFESLLTLPSRCAVLVAKLGNQSWRYSRLLVVFEAYPESHSYKATRRISSAPKIYPYSPPILKAVKKLRRDLSIAEACETKYTGCKIYLAFANTVEEAAWLARSFGELAEMNDDTRGAIWGTREWLDDFPHENEHDLASIDGMNVFASFVILCQKPLQEFLDLSPEARLKEFGPLIGVYRVALLSKVLGDHFQMMESARSSEPSVDADGTARMWTDEMLLDEY